MGAKGSKLGLKPGDVVSSAKAKEVWEKYYNEEVSCVDEAGARAFLSDYRKALKLDASYEQMYDTLIETCSVQGKDGRVFDLDAFRALLRLSSYVSPIELTDSMTAGAEEGDVEAMQAQLEPKKKEAEERKEREEKALKLLRKEPEFRCSRVAPQLEPSSPIAPPGRSPEPAFAKPPRMCAKRPPQARPRIPDPKPQQQAVPPFCNPPMPLREPSLMCKFVPNYHQQVAPPPPVMCAQVAVQPPSFVAEPGRGRPMPKALPPVMCAQVSDPQVQSLAELYNAKPMPMVAPPPVMCAQVAIQPPVALDPMLLIPPRPVMCASLPCEPPGPPPGLCGDEESSDRTSELSLPSDLDYGVMCAMVNDVEMEELRPPSPLSDSSVSSDAEISVKEVPEKLEEKTLRKKPKRPDSDRVKCSQRKRPVKRCKIKAPSPPPEKRRFGGLIHKLKRLGKREKQEDGFSLEPVEPYVPRPSVGNVAEDWSIDQGCLRASVAKLEETPIVLTVDLVKDSETLLNSIAEFGQREDLHGEESLKFSIHRYELFLCILSAVLSDKGQEEAARLVPPVDVAHVWRAHLIRPTVYRKDCMDLFGMQLPCSVLFSEHYQTLSGKDKEVIEAERAESVSRSATVWKEFADAMDIPIPYAPSVPEASLDLPPCGVTLSLAHLQEDIKWWVAFQFWRQEYDADKTVFLEKRLEEYKQFLRRAATEMLDAVEKNNSEMNTEGPPVDVDLFWHCHMLHPEYDSDLQSNLGYIFYHRPQADPEFLKA